MVTRRILLITADDFGYSSERDRGIIVCFRRGAITRASLLVNGVTAKNAAKLARTAGLPLGLHINLTEGAPVSAPGDVHTLIDPLNPGYFRGKMGFREALRSGSINLKQVAIEIRSQICWFNQLVGYMPFHIDGHQHVNVLPGLRETLASIQTSVGVATCRMPVELLEGCDWLPQNGYDFYTTVVEDAVDTRPLLRQLLLRSTDGFVGMATMGENMTLSRLQDRLLLVFQRLERQRAQEETKNMGSNTNSITCELMVHPGYPTVSEGGCGQGPDDFARSFERQHEMDILCSHSMLMFYKGEDITLNSSLP